MLCKKELNTIITNNNSFDSVLEAIIDVEVEKIAKKISKNFLNEITNFEIAIGKK